MEDGKMCRFLFNNFSVCMEGERAQAEEKKEKRGRKKRNKT